MKMKIDVNRCRMKTLEEMELALIRILRGKYRYIFCISFYDFLLIYNKKMMTIEIHDRAL